MTATILKRDAKGPEVKKLQLLLNSALTPPPHLVLDGFFAAGTEEAVTRFQRIHHLQPDGVVGPGTWTALGQRGITPLSDIMNLCVADAPWLEIAALELGVHEDAQPAKNTQRILEYHLTTSLKASTDEIPWCSSFVNWVMVQVRYLGTNSALAKSWLTWGNRVSPPRLGAVTIIKRKHQSTDALTGSTTGYHVGFHSRLPRRMCGCSEVIRLTL